MDRKDPLTRPWDERRRRATRIALIAILVLLALAIGVYVGRNQVEAVFPTGDAAVPAAGAAGEDSQAVPPPRASDGKVARAGDADWITIGGVVASVLPGQFTLDHRSGMVLVEMDDWDPAYREAMMLRKGDQVVVRGAIDDNLYLRKRIEAESVFVNNLNTYFYANAADEENRPAPGYRPNADAYVDLVGTVAAVEGRDLLLTIGNRQVRVDTSGLGSTSLDGVAPGDRLYLWGDMHFDAEAPSLAAKGVTRLNG